MPVPVSTEHHSCGTESWRVLAWSCIKNGRDSDSPSRHAQVYHSGAFGGAQHEGAAKSPIAREGFATTTPMGSLLYESTPSRKVLANAP